MISRAIIGLGQSLDLTVVAEGVEEPRHLAFLQAERCEYAQWYLLSRPLSASDLQQRFCRERRIEGLWRLSAPAESISA